MTQTRRDVILDAIEFRPPTYVPWRIGLTHQCADRLLKYIGTDDVYDCIGPSHVVGLGSEIGRFQRIDDDHYRDFYGVTWDRTVDKDIGTPCDWPIQTPADLDDYRWPDANDDAWYAGAAETLAARAGEFSVYEIGFSLYERAWSMRGMTHLLMDMIERPEFVERLMDAIVEHNLIQIRRALALGVDALYFGDDYGAQTGLIMGLDHWRHFIRPRLARMFEPVRAAGKYVYMHSCGKVAELFDDLLEIGLNVFNPFQPEVMDVFAIKKQYHGRLAFLGGMSIQKILPFGTVREVQDAAAKLIEMGRDGGYIFAPSHSVPPDTPPENLVAMMEVLRSQDGFWT